MKTFLRNIFRKTLDKNEQKVVDDIQQFGCHVSLVFDEKGELPDFAYSIGFPVTVGQPEVIVYGLKRELMHSMVNSIHRQCADGLTLKDDLAILDLIEGFECVARRVVDPEAIKEHFGWAIWYHRSQHGKELKEAYQIVWPGAQQGLYPWQSGCDEFVISQQPALYEPRMH
jgi:hypothetical protein